jgi:hypothetical protein
MCAENSCPVNKSADSSQKYSGLVELLAIVILNSNWVQVYQYFLKNLMKELKQYIANLMSFIIQDSSNKRPVVILKSVTLFCHPIMVLLNFVSK